MSIKQSMAMILLLLGVSFSAYSAEQTYRVATTNVSGESCSVTAGLTGTISMISGKLKACQLAFRGRVYANCFVSGTTSIMCNQWYGRAYGAGTLVPESCPNGQTLNAETGECESECKPKEGTVVGLLSFPKGTPTVSSACFSSCQAQLTPGTFIASPPDGSQPYGHYKYSGQSCTETDNSNGSVGGGDGGDSGGDGGDSGGDGGDGGDS
ncbi:hypothetical protein NM06_09610, partial [Vibrio sinaloensis]